MSGITGAEDLYSAIEESAELLGVDCSRDKVWPVLTAYEDALADAVIAFRAGTGTRHAGDLDCRFTMAPGEIDPYKQALSTGLLTDTDHPVGVLLSDIEERCPVGAYAIDFGVVGGFKKTWLFFSPENMQELSKLAEIPSMPRSLAENLDTFARHGLDGEVSLIGIDYRHRTVNLYFSKPPAECFEQKTILSMHSEMGLPDPTQQLLEFGQEAFGIYATLSWDSPKVERMCYARMTQDLTELPIPVDFEIEKFSKKVPCADGERRFVYAIAASSKGEYHKVQSYYRWRPQMLKQMLIDPAAG
ncbi:aromatic prenyltransferase [Streptomyces sp. NK08204]|uniref:aromatic prenyltransferase n=1 Tax=Streptomyces sp. NK08204 TaxID=2873260 RepID=UPI001CEDC1AD|nr:aromatic prenyltransferase [Streptomyces sp. NK08204]